MTAAGIPWADITAYIPVLTGSGVAGIWVACWLKGWIVSSREVERADESAAEWKSLYLQERDAHERTREALRLASERGESTAEALQLVAGVMNAVRVQAGHEDLPEAPRAKGIRGNRHGSEGDKRVHPAS